MFFTNSDVSTNIVSVEVTKNGNFTAKSTSIHSTVNLSNNSKANFYNLNLGNTRVSEGSLYLHIYGDYVKAPEDAKDGIEIKVKDTNEGND